MSQSRLYAILVILLSLPSVSRSADDFLVEAPSTQPAKAPAKSEPVKERKTADGVELPPVGRKWFGEGLKIGAFGDPIGKTPEEAFGGSGRLVRTLAKSRKGAEAALAKGDTRPLTMPYFVTGKWGADYVGFALLDGRIVALDVRWKALSDRGRLDIEKTYKDHNGLPPTMFPDGRRTGFRFSAISQQPEIGPSTGRPRPSWMLIEPAITEMFDSFYKPNKPAEARKVLVGQIEKGMSLEAVQAAARCNQVREGKDDKGVYFILSSPQPASIVEDEVVKYTDKLKVWIKDGGVERFEEISQDPGK